MPEIIGNAMVFIRHFNGLDGYSNNILYDSEKKLRAKKRRKR